jgi:hypothetical protein
MDILEPEGGVIGNQRRSSEGGVVDELCAPDAVSPAQFDEMWRGTAERSAEFKLALAVLEQALEDLEKHRRARDADRQRIYRQTRTWILSNDRRWPYSFVNVCEMLNVSFDRIRKHVLKERPDLVRRLEQVAAELRAAPASDDPVVLAGDRG